jgi:hypothetical protein
MKKFLLSVFTATLVLFFTVNLFAQQSVVKVATNAELVKALNDPNVKTIKFTQGGFYDALLQSFGPNDVLHLEKDTKGCTKKIETTDTCWVSKDFMNPITAGLEGDNCPSQPSSGDYGWYKPDPSQNFQYDFKAYDGSGDQYTYNVGFTAPAPGTYKIGYRWNNASYFETEVFLTGSPSLVSFTADKDSICGSEEFVITYEADTTSPAPLNITTEWYLDGNSIPNAPTDLKGTFPINFIKDCGWHTIEWLVSTGCGDVNASVNVYVYDTPAAFAGADFSVCGLTGQLGGDAKFGCTTTSSAQFHWEQISGPGTSIIAKPDLDTTDVIVTKCGDYEFKLTTSNGHCSSYDIVKVSFYETPTAEAGANQELCGTVVNGNFEGSGILEGSYDAACTGNEAFQWSLLNKPTGALVQFLQSSHVDTTEIIVNKCGQYDFLFTVYLGDSVCYASDTVTYVFYDSPRVYAGKDTSVCGLDYHFEDAADTVSCDLGNVTRSWEMFKGTGNATFPGNNNVTVTECGSYTFVYKVVNGICENTDTVNVSFYEKPVVDAGMDQEFCGTTLNNGGFEGGATLEGSFTAAYTDGKKQYLWEVLDSPMGSNVNFNPSSLVDTTDITVDVCGEYTFVFHVNLGGTICSSTDTVKYIFYDKPIVYAGQDTSVCGLDYYLEATDDVSCDLGSVTRSWEMFSGTGNATFPGNNNVTVTECGSYTFVYKVVNGVCENTDTVTINFIDKPDAYAGVDQDFCGVFTSGNYEGTATLIGDYNANCLDSADVQFKWHAVSPTPGSVTFDPANAENDTVGVVVDACGTYTFVLEVYSNTVQQCLATDTVVYRFYDMPAFPENADTSVCGMDVVMEHTNVTYDCDNGFAPTTNWRQIGGPGISTLAYNKVYDTTGMIPDTCHITVDVNGEYTFIYSFQNTACTKEDTIVVTFFDVPVLALQDDDTICFDTTYFIKADYIAKYTDSTSIVEDFVQLTGMSVVIKDTTISNQRGFMISKIPYCGEYSFEYTVKNGHGGNVCEAIDTVNLYLVDTPQLVEANGKIGSDTICGVLHYNLNPSYSVICPLKVDTTWSSKDAEVSFIGNKVVAEHCGTYEVVLTITNYPGCSASDTIYITFFDQPDIVFTKGDTAVYTCGTNTYIVDDISCNSSGFANLPTQIEWTVIGGIFSNGTTTATGTFVDVTWDKNGGPGKLKVMGHLSKDDKVLCWDTVSLVVNKQYPTFAGQVKYWNEAETYMPSPFATNDYCTTPYDYFYVNMLADTGSGKFDVNLGIKKVEPRLMEDLNELMSYFEYELPTDTLGCDVNVRLKVWDGGFYYDPNNVPTENRVLGNTYTYNNWGGVNATDALAIQLLAAGEKLNADYGYSWIGDGKKHETDIADVNYSQKVTALDALTTIYRSVGLLGHFPNNDPNHTDFEARYNFTVYGRLVDSLPEKTFPDYMTSGNYTDIRFKPRSSSDYLYFNQQFPDPTNYHFTVNDMKLGNDLKAGANYINVYYEAVGDINASFTPPGSGLKVEPKLGLEYEGALVARAGSEIVIPITADRDLQVGAVTLKFNYRNDLIEVLSTDYPSDNVMIDNENGILNMAWIDLDGKTISEGAAIAQIRVKVLQDIPAGTELFELENGSELADIYAEPFENVQLKTLGVSTDGQISNISDITLGNFPNPFNSVTTMSYTLPENGKVTLEVYNGLGQKVATVVDGESQEAGAYSVDFNAAGIKSGVYLYRITVQGETENYSAVKRMIVVH